MSIVDIIPDVHGQAQKLLQTLANLGWTRRGVSWSHVEPSRRIVFLGDFIDRGPENGAVIRTVRELLDSGRARAIMGNHELNALHFHLIDPLIGKPMRARSDKNTRQHATFLKEFPLGDKVTSEALAWMQTLPLYIEEESFRVVHAAWDQSAIDAFQAQSGDGVLTDDQLVRVSREDDPLHEVVEVLAKGPEACLPDGYAFADRSGHVRREIRLKWWNADAENWRDVAMSVPNLAQLPDADLPPSIAQSIYPVDAKPVFFGHYALTGKLALQSDNALCLDYSGAAGKPLVTYSFEVGSKSLRCCNLFVNGIAQSEDTLVP